MGLVTILSDLELAQIRICMLRLDSSITFGGSVRRPFRPILKICNNPPGGRCDVGFAGGLRRLGLLFRLASYRLPAEQAQSKLSLRGGGGEREA